jgi:predicted secreted Zn-dependent protease
MARLLAIAATIGVAFVLAAGAAQAGVSVKTKTVTYSINGKNGAALIEAMDRRGPKHGLLTRAIAQTAYTVSWDVDWRERSGRCRVAKANALIKITYTYPEVSGFMSRDLDRRWARFMSGVRKHEEMHGKIAKQMVGAAERALTALSRKSDRGCRKLQADMKRVIAEVYADYEARQIKFDEAEHSGGGNVERLLARLAD